MLHAYVDESYSEDWFFMAAAIGDDSQVATFENNLQWLVIGQAELHALATIPNELHGHELLQGIGAWRMVPIQDRMDIAAKALRIAAESGVTFMIRGLDRKAQRAKYRDVFEPYPMVLTQLMKNVNNYAHGQGVPIHVVCDEIHHDDRHRAMLERHRRQGTPGYSISKLQSVIGSLDFVPSSSSGMVQIADLVAYLKHRTVLRPNPARPERRSRDRFWQILEPRVTQDYIWRP